jgi:hypothetical protein
VSYEIGSRDREGGSKDNCEGGDFDHLGFSKLVLKWSDEVR